MFRLAAQIEHTLHPLTIHILSYNTLMTISKKHAFIFFYYFILKGGLCFMRHHLKNINVQKYKCLILYKPST